MLISLYVDDRTATQIYTHKQPFALTVITLDKIARNLRKDRMKSGALSFDRVEVNFNLKEDNTPESVFFKTSKDANKLIEEFMLLANKQVARFASSIDHHFFGSVNTRSFSSCLMASTRARRNRFIFNRNFPQKQRICGHHGQGTSPCIRINGADQ